MNRSTLKLVSLVFIFGFIYTGLIASPAKATQTKSEYFYSYQLTGDPATDIVGVAMAQINRTQSSIGYTEGWCADFVCDCAKIIGQSDAIPFYGGVAGLYNRIIQAGGTVVSSPHKGDIVFYYCTTDRDYCHVGIMEDSVKTVQGNVASKVQELPYPGYYRDHYCEKGKEATTGICYTISYVRPNYKKKEPASPVIPTISVSSFGLHADVSWNDVGAQSYRIRVQNLDTGDVPVDNNIGRECSCQFSLAEGRYRVNVYATFSNNSMASGSASFKTEVYKANIDKGMDGIYNVNDSVTMSLNTSNFDTCSLSIYRTPNGGETYKYWEYPINTSSYTLTFPDDGYYCCCFTLKKGSYTIESEWVGWSVVAPSYTISYDANGGKNAPSSQLKKKSVDLQITSEFPICSGYAFLGWATVKNSKTPEYQPGDIYIENADATLYAVWLKPDLILPDALMDIEEEAFAGGTFQFVWLSDSVRSISSRAFADCPNLKHIRIPHQMTLATLMRLVRTEDAFEGCEGITVHGEDNPYSKAFATRYGFNYIADE